MLKKHDVSSLLASAKIVPASQHKSESTKEELSVYQAHIQPSYRVGRGFIYKGNKKNKEVTFVSCCRAKRSLLTSKHQQKRTKAK